jgi:hypothetical protein
MLQLDWGMQLVGSTSACTMPSAHFFDLALSRFACGTQQALALKCVLGSGDSNAVFFV